MFFSGLNLLLTFKVEKIGQKVKYLDEYLDVLVIVSVEKNFYKITKTDDGQKGVRVVCEVAA